MTNERETLRALAFVLVLVLDLLIFPSIQNEEEEEENGRAPGFPEGSGPSTRNYQPSTLCSAPQKFLSQRTRIVDLAQGFNYRAGMDCQCSGLVLGIYKIGDKRLDVPVENNPDKFTVSIDDGAAGVTADNVGGANKVKRSAEVELFAFLKPALGQVKGRVIVVFFGSLVKPGKRRLEWNCLSSFLIALHDAKGQA